MNIQISCRKKKTVQNYFEYTYVGGDLWQNKEVIDENFYETFINQLIKHIGFEKNKENSLVDTVYNIKPYDSLSDCSVVFYLNIMRASHITKVSFSEEYIGSTRVIVLVEYVMKLALVKVRILHLITPQIEQEIIRKNHQNFSKNSISHIIEVYFESKIHGYVIEIKGVIEKRRKFQIEGFASSGMLALHKKIVLVPYCSPYEETFFKRLS